MLIIFAGEVVQQLKGLTVPPGLEISYLHQYRMSQSPAIQAPGIWCHQLASLVAKIHIACINAKKPTYTKIKINN